MNKPIPKERNERKGYDIILFENHKKRIMNMIFLNSNLIHPLTILHIV